MSSPYRYAHNIGRIGEVNNHGTKFSSQKILDVKPLNSMPPPFQPCNSAHSATKVAAPLGPAVVYLPSCPDNEEWCKIVEFSKQGIGLTGSAAVGRVGPIIGLIDIAECDDSYLFRVSLPGVTRDENNFNFDLQPNGKIHIKGFTATGEKTVFKNSQRFEMKTQNLCPPGDFTATFQLPGPVDHLQLSASFGTDGILQGTVKKIK